MQARDKAGSLEIVSKVLPDDDDFPELPDEVSDDEVQIGTEELVGTKDADELVLAELGEGPESVGLDTESGVEERGEGAADFLDAEDGDGGSWTHEEAGIDVEAELDLGDDDEGFTGDSEGMAGSWDDDELGLDDDAPFDDDGGLEGVEDPLLDELGLEEREGSVLDDDGDAEGAEVEIALGDELSLSAGWPRTRRE